MANDVWQIVLQCLFAFAASYIFFVIGNFALKIFPVGSKNITHKYQQVYTAMVLGLVLFVLIYSLVTARFITINILFVPILALLFFLRKRMGTSYPLRKTSPTNPWILSFLVSIFFVLLFHLLPEAEYKQNDALYYLQISNALSATGQENTYGAVALQGKPYVGTEAYHYFEFWLNALLLKCTGNSLPQIQVLRFVCYPIICTVALFGLMALAAQVSQKKLSKSIVFLTTAFIFFVPDLLCEFKWLQPVLIYHFESNVIERPNLRTLFLFLPGLLLLLDTSGNRWKMLFWVAGIAISSVLYFVIILPAVTLYSLILFLKKKIQRQDFYAAIVVLGAFAVLYVAFYVLTGSKLHSTQNSISVSSIVPIIIRYWKIISFSFFTSVVHTLWAPAIVLLILKSKSRDTFHSFFKHRKMIIFLFTLIAISIAVARVFATVENAYQFAYTGYTAGWFLAFILMIILADKFFNSIKSYALVAGICVLLFLMQRFLFPKESYQPVYRQNGAYIYDGVKFSDAYLQQVKNEFRKKRLVTGAYWADSSFYNSLYYSRRNPNIYFLPTEYIIANIAVRNESYCLSDSDDMLYGMDTSKHKELQYLQGAILRSVFYNDGVLHKEKINQRRLHFIWSHQIDYIVLSPDADTSLLSRLPVVNRFADSSTGERVYILGNYKN